jgi:hypothetical protein
MNGMEQLEKVVMTGDLSTLTPEQRITYYKAVCASLDLNPLTRPFDYLRLGGKLVLYARKDCTEQLRTKHEVSIIGLETATVNGIYTVTAHARNKEGREDVDLGAVSLVGLGGEELSNAMMKGVTKAKRRVTLSICGLGMLDETEVEGLAGAEPMNGDAPPAPQLGSHVRPGTVGEGPVITEGQLKRFHAIARGGGWSDAAVKGMLQSFGIASSKDIKREQYEELCAIVAKAPGDKEVPF